MLDFRRPMHLPRWRRREARLADGLGEPQPVDPERTGADRLANRLCLDFALRILDDDPLKPVRVDRIRRAREDNRQTRGTVHLQGDFGLPEVRKPRIVADDALGREAPVRTHRDDLLEILPRRLHVQRDELRLFQSRRHGRLDLQPTVELGDLRHGQVVPTALVFLDACAHRTEHVRNVRAFSVHDAQLSGQRIGTSPRHLRRQPWTQGNGHDTRLRDRAFDRNHLVRQRAAGAQHREPE